MFSSMFEVIAWGFVVSGVVIGIAVAAEGRALHLVRVLLGINPQGKGIDAATLVPRADGDWGLVPGSDEPAEDDDRALV